MDWQIGAAKNLRVVHRTTWDGSAAKKNIFRWAGFDGDSSDTKKARLAFFAYDADKAEEKGSYKLPFCDIEEGKLVAIDAALVAVRQRVRQSDLPSELIDRIFEMAGDYLAKAKKGLYIKSLNDRTIEVGGYGIVFGGNDLDGDTFSAQTDYMLDLVPKHLVLYDHNFSGIDDVLGYTKTVLPDDVGLWVEAELSRHDQYMDYIMPLIQKGVLGWSSGTIGNMIKRSINHIDRWPIIEFSLTPTPAEPRTLGVSEIERITDEIPVYRQINQLKSLVQGSIRGPTGSKKMNNEEIKQYIDEQMQDLRKQMSVSMKSSSESATTSPNSESQITPEIRNAITGVENRLSQQIDKLLEIAEKNTSTAGYVSNLGGQNDKGTKSFADFLLAVKRKDVRRLEKIYNASSPYKDIGDDTGESGGYLLPVEYHDALMQLVAESSPIVQMVTYVPVSTMSGRYPVVDQFLVPDAGVGDTALAGGIVARSYGSGSSGGTSPETTAKFEMLNWQVHKVGGHVDVDDELVNYSPYAIEGLLQSLFAVAIAAKKEYYVLRGTGNGEPLGILNSDAVIRESEATTDLFSYTDVRNMMAHLRKVMGTPVWIIHPSFGLA